MKAPSERPLTEPYGIGLFLDNKGLNSLSWDLKVGFHRVQLFQTCSWHALELVQYNNTVLRNWELLRMEATILLFNEQLKDFSYTELQSLSDKGTP